MKHQPGFISTELHRAIGESPTYLNYAVWESYRRYCSTSDMESPYGFPPNNSLLNKQFLAVAFSRTMPQPS